MEGREGAAGGRQAGRRPLSVAPHAYTALRSRTAASAARRHAHTTGRSNQTDSVVTGFRPAPWPFMGITATTTHYHLPLIRTTRSIYAHTHRTARTHCRAHTHTRWCSWGLLWCGHGWRAAPASGTQEGHTHLEENSVKEAGDRPPLARSGPGTVCLLLQLAGVMAAWQQQTALPPAPFPPSPTSLHTCHDGLPVVRQVPFAHYLHAYYTLLVTRTYTRGAFATEQAKKTRTRVPQ